MGIETELVGDHWEWQQIRRALDAFDPPGILRMADGALLFPDETPADDWKEIRVGLPAGMVTLRRGAQNLKLVTWGNISKELEDQRDRLARLLQSPN